MLPLAAGAAGTSLALAQGYPVSPPGAVYSTAPQPYPPGGYPADYRRGPGAPDFDALEDDEAPNAQSSTALPPPGPVLSPDDPRYGRPMGAPPVYSDRAAPTGPVMSPDDPRYGRPTGAPPVYSDRAVPTGPILSPDDPALWPPRRTAAGDLFGPRRRIAAIPIDDARLASAGGRRRSAGAVTGSVQPAPIGRRRQADGVVRAAAG